VYLDQWVWVELAKVVKGSSTDATFQDLLELARFGVRHKLVSFPLSLVHYMELHHTRSAQRRYEVGSLMHQLSQGHRMMIPVPDLIEAEFDTALQKRFGVPEFPRTVQVFGIGTGHVYGRPPIVGHIVSRDGGEPEGIDPVWKARIEARANELTEEMLLCGPPEGVDVPGYDPNAHRVFADQFVTAEEDQANKFREHGADSRYQRRVLLAREWILLVREIALNALIHAGIDPDWFFSQGAEFLADFIADMPVVNASLEMRRLQHQNPDRPWSPNDHYDVQALSMAVVHCDVVVTEKHWAHVIRRAGLDQVNSTLVLDRRRLPELLPYLAAVG
jgi:hypothetical protein